MRKIKSLIVLIALLFFQKAESQTNLITTVVGSTKGYSGDGNLAINAQINRPYDIAFDKAGNMYISDNGNNCIRKVNAIDGKISTIAGTTVTGYNGDSILATTAELNAPQGICLDSHGNIYIADFGNACVRKIDVASGMITKVAGIGGHSGTVPVDGTPATDAFLVWPGSVAVDSNENVYIADEGVSKVYKIVDGKLYTAAGTGRPGFSGDRGLAINAQLDHPVYIVFDKFGNLYIDDTDNGRVRKVNASDGIINTVAGNGTGIYSGDGGKATAAGFSLSLGIALDSAENLYIADLLNGVIRKVNASDSIISTIAGTGIQGFSGDGGPAIQAQILPTGIEVNSRGEIFITNDSTRIRKIYEGTLPITLSSFAATKKQTSVLLNWQTANEQNNAYFIIERSNSSNTKFMETGKVNSKGNSNHLQQYSFEDLNPFIGANYYRLTQVDKDGKSTYSKIVFIDFSKAATIKLYPNPVKDVITLEGLQGTSNISIISLQGSVLAKSTASSNTYTWNIKQLPAGTYYVRIEVDKNVTTLKFVKE